MLLKMTPLRESIVVLQDNEDDNEPRYVEFSTDNSANIDDLYPILLSDSESDNNYIRDQEITVSTYLDSSNLDSKLIRLLLEDGEYSDSD